ncbi:DUF1697 domain-containing protein [Jatrophihabitans sp. YIM 134969]
MTRWAAFLRGVNVGSITVTSAALKQCLEALGLEDVRTVLASGNAVFSSPRRRTTLKPAIEKALRDTFGYDAWIVLLDAADFEAAIDGCTLQPVAGWHTYYLLGSDEKVLDELDELAPADEPHARGPHVLYWQVEEGHTLTTPFAKILAQRKYKAHTTSRNARTMAKVAALL